MKSREIKNITIKFNKQIRFPSQTHNISIVLPNDQNNQNSGSKETVKSEREEYRQIISCDISFDMCKIDDKTVTVPIFNSTFTVSGNYSIKIDNDFVISNDSFGIK